MKTQTVIIAILFFIPQHAPTQADVQYPFKVKFKTCYKLTSPKEKLKGTTISITDTTAIMINSYIYNPSLTNYNYKIIPYQRIKTFEAQRMNRLENSLIVCTIIGTVGGLLIGVKKAELSYELYGAAIGAGVGALSGIVVGAVIGITKIVIPINGSKEAFAKEKQRLDKYSVENY